MDRLAARKDGQLGFCVRGHLSVSVDYMESLSHSMPIYAYVFLVFFHIQRLSFSVLFLSSHLSLFFRFFPSFPFVATK